MIYHKVSIIGLDKRFVAEQESLIFGTLDQLLVDKRLRFSMLAGQVCLCLCVYLFWCIYDQNHGKV